MIPLRADTWAAILLAVVLAACVGGAAPGADAVPAASPSLAPLPMVTAPSAPPRVRRAPERLDAVAPMRPAQPSMAVRFAVALVADPCVDRDLAAPVSSDDALTLLDRSYALDATFEPDDLVPAAEAGLTGASGSKLVRAVVIEDLAAMRSAWEDEGLAIAIDSAYRSYASQAATFSDWAARLGETEARLRAARPGHSEHQLGTAIDVSSPGWSGRFGDWALDTAEGGWMVEHAWRYGFVMSYPAGAQSETCFGYEPWHYRWIGREAAAEMRAAELTLREYLERHVGG